LGETRPGSRVLLLISFVWAGAGILWGCGVLGRRKRRMELRLGRRGTLILRAAWQDSPGGMAVRPLGRRWTPGGWPGARRSTTDGARARSPSCGACNGDGGFCRSASARNGRRRGYLSCCRTRGDLEDVIEGLALGADGLTSPRGQFRFGRLVREDYRRWPGGRCRPGHRSCATVTFELDPASRRLPRNGQGGRLGPGKEFGVVLEDRLMAAPKARPSRPRPAASEACSGNETNGTRSPKVSTDDDLMTFAAPPRKLGETGPQSSRTGSIGRRLPDGT